ncbi:myo-inosose-2 dehydratase [Lichenihabitans sp. Uapishka_5]|uniref:myo-inosose-2 dehydratase n=1 Tax=Lichenihabitans sp. Uapishka_5 TaxID=3037302 RepID=UPI0029E7DBB2|nr:myo-inosose-2 dehydratase [Lichenihabitans sp. Uapishka_5]MDX7951573.1 myo-inosose-2 dehydratase [Lichenihabitans sp. Uapishka_5]
MTIRIGANPIGWSNDDLIEIGGATPLETCLSEAREAGIVGMELGNKFPREPAALKAALEPYGMRCIGGWHSIELLRRSPAEEFAAAKPHRDLLKAMGTDVFIVCETSNTVHGSRGTALSRRPIMAAGDWAPYGAKVTDFASRLADEGLTLCYHHHMGTIVQTEAEIDAFMGATKAPANLLLDTGHATWGGADPAKLARTYRERITHVHCKDVRLDKAKGAEAEDLSFLDAILGQGAELGVYTVPGDGSVDYTAVFKALTGYSGWVVLEAEQDPVKADPLTYARKGVAHLKACLAEAGLP